MKIIRAQLLPPAGQQLSSFIQVLALSARTVYGLQG